MARHNRPSMGTIIYLLGCLLLGSSFAFTAVQGDHGVFRMVEVQAEATDLRVELAALQAEVARMENLTHRLSDEFLDLDLLDQQARNMLGMVRADEIVLH